MSYLYDIKKKQMYRNPIIINKDNLNKAFEALRKAGYFARQNFKCCQTCGFAAVPEEKEKVVFYHQQDNDRLKESGKCYVSWAGNGFEIVNIFNNNGVKTNWNKSPDTRIEIDINI